MSDPAVIASGLADLTAQTAKLNPTGNYSGPVSGPINTTTIVASGNVFFTNLPTADPNVLGELWNSSGTLKVSAG